MKITFSQRRKRQEKLIADMYDWLQVAIVASPIAAIVFEIISNMNR